MLNTNPNKSGGVFRIPVNIYNRKICTISKKLQLLSQRSPSQIFARFLPMLHGGQGKQFKLAFQRVYHAFKNNFN